MSHYSNSGRFMYARGFKSQYEAWDAFCDMCNSGEMSPTEGKIESYKTRNTDRLPVTRYAITTPL